MYTTATRQPMAWRLTFASGDTTNTGSGAVGTVDIQNKTGQNGVAQTILATNGATASGTQVTITVCCQINGTTYTGTATLTLN